MSKDNMHLISKFVTIYQGFHYFLDSEMVKSQQFSWSIDFTYKKNYRLALPIEHNHGHCWFNYPYPFYHRLTHISLLFIYLFIWVEFYFVFNFSTFLLLLLLLFAIDNVGERKKEGVQCQLLQVNGDNFVWSLPCIVAFPRRPYVRFMLRSG